MSGRPYRVLFVEDDPLLRDTIGAMLEAEGREITLADDAESALRAESIARFDLVVSDVGLPGMSGVELARRLLRDAPGRAIVLCSGAGILSAAALGPNVRTLAKPFDVDALEALIRAAPRAD